MSKGNSFSGPGRDKQFFSSPKCPVQLWGATSLPFSGYGLGGSVSGGKRPEVKADQLGASTVEVQNEESYTFTSQCMFMECTESLTFVLCSTKFYCNWL
jgi:hypothetical protein